MEARCGHVLKTAKMMGGGFIPRKCDEELGSNQGMFLVQEYENEQYL